MPHRAWAGGMAPLAQALRSCHWVEEKGDVAGPYKPREGIIRKPSSSFGEVESPEVQIRQEEGPVWDQRGVADERLREIGAQGPRDPPDAQLHPLQNLRRDGAGSHQLHRSQDREPNGGVIQLCQAEHFEWSCGHGH